MSPLLKVLAILTYETFCLEHVYFPNTIHIFQSSGRYVLFPVQEKTIKWENDLFAQFKEINSANYLKQQQK